MGHSTLIMPDMWKHLASHEAQEPEKDPLVMSVEGDARELVIAIKAVVNKIDRHGPYELDDSEYADVRQKLEAGARLPQEAVDQIYERAGAFGEHASLCWADNDV